jgi:hypothetical protein
MTSLTGRSACSGWTGMALLAGGVLVVAATLLHPSHETAVTIIASEARLVAAHVTYTLSWLLVLLGLPGLYAAQRGWMGRVGLAGFLTAFTGTYLIAVTGNFGFLAPVLARESPGVLVGPVPARRLGERVGRPRVRGRLSPVRRRDGPDADDSPAGRRPGRGGWSAAPVRVRPGPARHPGAMADRHSGALALGVGLGWSGYRLWRTQVTRDRLPAAERTRA